MTGDEIVYYLIHPDLLNEKTLVNLQRVIASYPSFEMARILYMKNLELLKDIRFKAELKKSILYIQDRRFLYYFIKKRDASSSFKTSSSFQNVDKTTEILEAFFLQLDDNEKLFLADQKLNCFFESNYSKLELSTNQTVEEVNEKIVGDDIINEFLDQEKHFSFNGKKEDKEIVSPDLDISEKEKESFFTETLAKIYIKQQKYGRAIEIFRKLYLKYPEKSSYFAIEIDKVEQLILNEKE